MNALFEQAVDAHTACPPGSNRRAAALLLHGMAEADRAWAWSRLDDAERAVLSPLLDELRDMRIPRDGDLLRQATATAAAVSPGLQAAARQRIAAAQPAELVQVLGQEPSGLVRRLLSLGPWPWSEAVQTALRARRGDVFEAASDADQAPGDALAAALLERVAQRLAPAVPGHGPSRGWWTRLRDRGLHRLPKVAR